MEQLPTEFSLLKDIVDRISVGVFVVNKQNELVLWNGYMENYSQTKADDVVGKNIFDSFPDLPRNWLEQKIHNVFVIKNFSFTSWEHRPYLFKFLHNRPITGGIDYMRQNCTFLPMKGETGDIEYVCVTLFDVTDTSIYENMLKNAVRSLAEQSNRDGLTNVYNRRFLETSMSKEFSRINRYGGTLTFIIIDLDHFKAVNDTHGHLAGDEILKVAATRIAEGLRTADTLSRYGGEEFAVMLPETPIDGAAVLAQRLCDNLSASPVNFGDNSITVSASLGVAEFEPGMASYEIMIARADEMLYRSKENGRNQVTIYYPEHENSNHENEQQAIAVIKPDSHSANIQDNSAIGKNAPEIDIISEAVEEMVAPIDSIPEPDIKDESACTDQNRKESPAISSEPNEEISLSTNDVAPEIEVKPTIETDNIETSTIELDHESVITNEITDTSATEATSEASPALEIEIETTELETIKTENEALESEQENPIETLLEEPVINESKETAEKPETTNETITLEQINHEEKMLPETEVTEDETKAEELNNQSEENHIPPDIDKDQNAEQELITETTDNEEADEKIVYVTIGGK